MVADQILLDADIPTTSTPYTIGDSIGGLVVQNPGVRIGNGRIVDAKFVDTLNQKPALTIFFFDDYPSASTITDNAAFVLAAADVSKIVGILGIAAIDWVTVDSKAFCNVATQIELRWPARQRPGATSPSITKLWMAIVAGTAPTYGANSTSLVGKFGLDTVRP